MDAAIGYARPLLQRTDDYAVRLPSIHRTHQCQEDRSLAFATERANPESRFSTLPQLGPLQMLSDLVFENGTQLVFYDSKNGLVFKHNLQRDAPWKMFYRLSTPPTNVSFSPSKRTYLRHLCSYRFSTYIDKWGNKFNPLGTEGYAEGTHFLNLHSIDYHGRFFLHSYYYNSPIDNDYMLFSEDNLCNRARISAQTSPITHTQLYVLASHDLCFFYYLDSARVDYGRFASQKCQELCKFPVTLSNRPPLTIIHMAGDSSENVLYAITERQFYFWDVRESAIHFTARGEQYRASNGGIWNSTRMLCYNDGHSIILTHGHDCNEHMDLRSARKWTRNFIPVPPAHTFYSPSRFYLLD